MFLALPNPRGSLSISVWASRLRLNSAWSDGAEHQGKGAAVTGRPSTSPVPSSEGQREEGDRNRGPANCSEEGRGSPVERCPRTRAGLSFLSWVQAPLPRAVMGWEGMVGWGPPHQKPAPRVSSQGQATTGCSA